MRVRWTRSAIKDLDSIQDFIARDSPAAAYRVAVEVTDRLRQTLGTFPQSGRVGLLPGTREFVFDPLPYIVVYRVGDTVDILSVIHAAQDRGRGN